MNRVWQLFGTGMALEAMGNWPKNLQTLQGNKQLMGKMPADRLGGVPSPHFPSQIFVTSVPLAHWRPIHFASKFSSKTIAQRITFTAA